MEQRCAFFLPKKGRYCRMNACKGSKYCAEHLLSDGDKSYSEH